MNSDSLFACKMWKLMYVFTFCFSLSVALKTVTQVPNTHNRYKNKKQTNKQKLMILLLNVDHLIGFWQFFGC